MKFYNRPNLDRPPLNHRVLKLYQFHQDVRQHKLQYNR